MIAGAPRIASAQQWQFWPQINVYTPAHASTQAELEADWTASRDSAYRQLRLGFALQTRAIAHLMFKASYNYFYTPSNSKKNESRAIAEGTVDVNLPAQLVLLDRNAFDFRWLGGTYSTRYRNRLRLERPFHRADTQGVTPYVQVEVAYTFSSGTITRVQTQLGAEYRLSTRLTLDGSFAHQDDRSASTDNVNAVQLTAKIYW
jgi:hypothetical protein